MNLTFKSGRSVKLLPFVSSQVYVPKSFFTDAQVAAFEKELTVEIREGQGATAEVYNINCLDSVTKKNFYGFPRAWALERFKGKKFINLTKTGNHYTDMQENCKVTPRDKSQANFMSDLLKTVSNKEVVDYVANASTGSGKSISATWLSCQISAPTLIIIPWDNLQRQWYGEEGKPNGLMLVFGKDWVEKNVGKVQQDICDYKGKRFVLGSLSSLARRDYGEDFYNYFGHIVLDELHRAAAPQMCKVLTKFPAFKRGGFTATNKSGNAGKLVEFHLGKPKVISQQEMLKPIVYDLKYFEVANINMYNDAIMKTSISNLRNRNSLLVDIIESAYKRDRNIVGLSDRIKQLQIIEKNLIKRGVPKEMIGIYAGEKYIVEPTTGHITDQKYKVKQEELARILKECKIILATYGIFSTGMDVPHLDVGVECTPRVDLKQSIGRIVRLKEGKPTPEWYTITDDIRKRETAPVNVKLMGIAKAKQMSFHYHKATVKEITNLKEIGL
jgi:superfamily II DNA or RNA helicase